MVRNKRIWPTQGLGALSPHIAGPLAPPLVHATRCAFLTGVFTTFLSFFLSFLPIHMALQDCVLLPVAISPLVTRVRKGLTNCHRDIVPLPQRLPLPISVAYAIMGLDEYIILKADWTPQDPHLTVLRAAIASIVSYVFFNRGECSACALTSHLVVRSTHIHVESTTRKGGKMAHDQ